MKKIISILAMASAAAVVLASCNKNQPPVFDDSKAFIAFSSTSTTVSESADTISIPVSLASVAGLSASATFTVTPDTTVKKDGSKIVPKEGVNYKILTEGGTLRFDAKNRTQYIRVAGVYCPDYTGDLSITISLVSQTKEIGLGASKSCKIVITDIDHPLTPMLGAYSASGDDYWDGESTWTMTIAKDADDPQKVWISDWANLGGNASAVGPIYGNVDEDMTKITIPFGQVSKATYGGARIVSLGIDASLNGYETGSTTASIVKNGEGKVTKIVFDSNYGFWCFGEAGANFGIVCAETYRGVPFVATKK